MIPITDPSLLFGPSLPLYASIPAAILWIALVALTMAKLRNRLAAFVVFAFLLRYLLAAFHEYTFKGSPIGLSWNALGSVATLGVGLLLINRRTLALRMMAPLYLLLIVTTISAVVNDAPANYLNAFTKFCYFGIIVLCIYGALEQIGERLMPALLVTFSGPVLFQILSVLTHVAKAGENDGSASYIGGFAHESPFSMILGTGLMVAALSRKVRPLLVNLAVLVFIGSILVANYRTTVLALAPLLLVQLLTSSVEAINVRQRLFSLIAVFALLGMGAGAVAIRVADRYADLGQIGQLPALLIEPSNQLTYHQRSIFSGRVALWNLNVRGYLEGPERGYLIGAGPEQRPATAPLYPHNTLIGALFEYGALGVAAYLLLWGNMLAYAFRVRSTERVKLIVAHLSFFVLNMATMPFWNVEGTLLYGVLCGYTYYRYRMTETANTSSTSRPSPIVRRSERVASLA